MKFLFFLTFIVAIYASNEDYGLQNPNLLQGDILVPEGVDVKHATLYGKKWPGGVIPYVIDSASGYTSSELSLITNAMRTIESQTGNCLTYKPRTTESAYIVIRHTTTGCNSYVGQIASQPQQVSLQRPSCLYTYGIIHELLHAAGFEHEHCRIDRDNYINIIWGNVGSSWTYAFDKIPSTQATTLGLPYDFYSVMHYRKDAFTANGQDTITSKIAGVNMNQVGTRSDMSSTDVQKVKKHYGCA